MGKEGGQRGEGGGVDFENGAAFDLQSTDQPNHFKFEKMAPNENDTERKMIKYEFSFNLSFLRAKTVKDEGIYNFRFVNFIFFRVFQVFLKIISFLKLYSETCVCLFF